MAPGKLKLATSWPQDYMKADISQTYIEPTNSLGKTMILCIPHAQFASKMAQVRAKIRSKSDPSRSKPIQADPNPIQADPIRPNPVPSDPKSDPDRSMAAPSRIRIGPWPLQVGSGWPRHVGTHRNSSQLIATHPKSSERKPIGLSIVQAKCVVLLDRSIYLYIDICIYTSIYLSIYLTSVSPHDPSSSTSSPAA